MQLAKYKVYTRYLGCITDQSSCSCGPFSLVVLTTDLESGNLGSPPIRNAQLKGFIYRSNSSSKPTIHILAISSDFTCQRFVI